MNVSSFTNPDNDNNIDNENEHPIPAGTSFIAFQRLGEVCRR